MSTSRAATCARYFFLFLRSYTMSNNPAANARTLGVASDGQTALVMSLSGGRFGRRRE